MTRAARARYVEGVSTAVIKTDGLTKRFPRITALDQLTVEVQPGVVGLVGANGAGKSTLIKILLGLAPATSGRGEVLGLDIATRGSEIRERVGYMPEHDCLPPDVSATEFVVHMARMAGLPATAARERTADTLRHVGLYEERYRPMGGYSTGMKQRVKLAQALVHDPRLVLLDEPTNGLDPAGRDEMLGLIRRVHTDFGISVLVTTHLLGELERTCDHLVVIDGGRLLRSSSTASFTEATAVLAVEVTDHPEDHTVEPGEAVRARLAAAGVDVRPEGSHLVLVRLADESTYDTIRDTVAGLGLGLVRLEQRRHRVAELFTEGPDTVAPPAVPDAPEGRNTQDSRGGSDDVAAS
ncbi:ABC transporter ATP-binding protein [Kitasatospora sp. NPDC048545]|uniref:ABC transporter ATP-binding protein n=1 Tax=Kitasatospora sp. NPDC048545 TaxID=3157208 RepID=UPI0033C70296